MRSGFPGIGFALLALFGAGLSAPVSGQSIGECPIPTTGALTLNIAAGPDGALWFAEFGTNKIGRITTAGVVTEFTVPTAGSSPQGIVAGPDGALWFTEEHASKVGRITTAGVITEFLTPTASHPSAMTVGPYGALWFVADSILIDGLTT